MPPRRPGPRADLDGRTAVLDAAERLFSRDWYETVSLRAVAREASVNPAALSHHFADREALLAAVVARRGEGFDRHIRDGLLALHAAPTVSASQLIRVLVEPYVEIIRRDPIGGYNWVKMLIAMAMREHPLWLGLGRGDPPSSDILDALFVRAFPHLPMDVLELRAAIAMFGLLNCIATAELPAHRGALTKTGLRDEFVNELIEFAATGLTRPL